MGCLVLQANALSKLLNNALIRLIFHGEICLNIQIQHASNENDAKRPMQDEVLLTK